MSPALDLDLVEGAARRLLRFYALLLFALATPACAAAPADCRVPAAATAVTVKRVIDGDTVTLADGRSLRLIGVNTPELGRRGGDDDPLATTALAELTKLLRPAGLRLVPGREAFDRHGRSLGDLFLADGALAAAAMVRSGLGFAVAVPPNDSRIACLLAAEREARAARRGIWADPTPWTFSAALPPPALAGKFRRATGPVTALQERRAGLSIEMGGSVELWVPADRRAVLAPALARISVGASLTVRGWWGSYRGRPNLRLEHPAQIEAEPAGAPVETSR